VSEVHWDGFLWEGPDGWEPGERGSGPDAGAEAVGPLGSLVGGELLELVCIEPDSGRQGEQERERYEGECWPGRVLADQGTACEQGKVGERGDSYRIFCRRCDEHDDHADGGDALDDADEQGAGGVVGGDGPDRRGEAEGDGDDPGDESLCPGHDPRR
jgi:hypothetical protein